jgi:hypothetical protein
MSKISKEMLEIYKDCQGDIDMLSRTGTKLEENLFCNNQWSIIDDAIQNLFLIDNSKVSNYFRQKALTKIEEYFEENSLILLRQLK